jgi:hypothetical protein
MGEGEIGMRKGKNRIESAAIGLAGLGNQILLLLAAAVVALSLAGNRPASAQPLYPSFQPDPVKR